MTYKNLSFRVRSAFRLLRKQGYICLGDFMCCNSCACARITKDHPGAKKTVFWHKQDTERAKNAEKNLTTPFLYLTWDGDSHDIAGALRAAGLTVIVPDSDKDRFLVF